MKLSALSGMVVFGDLAAIGRGADGAPDLIGPHVGAGHERRAPQSQPLGERQAESGWVRLLAVPGDQESLEPTRHEAEQQGRLVADNLDRMRHTARKSRVSARPHLDAGIADPRD